MLSTILVVAVVVVPVVVTIVVQLRRRARRAPAAALPTTPPITHLWPPAYESAGAAACRHCGESLLHDQTPAAREMRAFLEAVHLETVGTPIGTVEQLGTTWLWCLMVAGEQPCSALAARFIRLHDAAIAARRQAGEIRVH